MLTESLLISSLAGIFGWLLASIAAPALVGMVSTRANPIELDLALNIHVLLFSAAICALSALFFGLLPAWQATSNRPISGLRHPGEQVGGLRLGRIFVGVQIAFAFCLVTGGACFVYSLRNLVAVDTGFDARDVTVLTITNTPERGNQLVLMRQIQMRTAGAAACAGRGYGLDAGFFGRTPGAKSSVAGSGAIRSRGDLLPRLTQGISRHFVFLCSTVATLRLKDNDNEPVPTIVNRTFARKYFGNAAGAWQRISAR